MRAAVLLLLFFFYGAPLLAATTANSQSNLQVNLVDATTQQSMPQVAVTAYELRGNRLRWAQRRITDENGVANFNLRGLVEGSIYRFKARVYNFTTAQSGDVSQPGVFKFEVGKLAIKVIDKSTQAPFIEAPVVLKEQLANGALRGNGRGRTDQDGIVRFDPSGLGEGKRYVISVRNIANHKWSTSTTISTPGQHQIEVGNLPVHVTLLDALTSNPLPNQRYNIYEQLPRGQRWKQRGSTDENGMVTLDLDGIDEGRSYIMRVRPYNRIKVYSENITEPGDHPFKVGNVPVTLVDGETEQVFPRKLISAFRKTPDGGMELAQSGYSDQSGSVFFTLPFDAGQHYVFSVRDPFGSRKSLFSEVIAEQGRLRFEILKDGDHDLDETPPTVDILTPQDGGQVTPEGFLIQGLARDDKEIKSITVQINSPTSGVARLETNYDEASQAWVASVPNSLVSIGDTLVISAIAIDKGLNSTTASIQVLVAEDQLPPEISITSHTSGGNVSESGFLISGTATDDSEIKSLQITLDDPLLGRTVDQLLLVEPLTDAWNLLVAGSQISLGETVTIQLTAIDSVDNQTSVLIMLNVVPVDVTARHLINRITFGATPDLVQELTNIGPDAYLQQQLDPVSIDDSALDAIVSGFEPSTLEELEQYVLQHMVYSKRQLREVMTWFWDNHFNTDIDTERGDFADNASYELAENRAFRNNALGNFRDLLGISAHSPAMLIYLDSVRNEKSDANENYIRELLELHTMRVDGGFTHHEIHAGAEIFTGWTIRNDVFFFNAAQHNSEEHTFLGTLIPAGGVEQGEQILDILASHPSTANFMCEKLSRVFITDMPSAELINRCAAVFLLAANDSDQIAQVVSMLIGSPEFSSNHRSKVKTPVELVVGAVRTLQALTDATDLAEPMVPMGLRLFKNDRPTGWSETGDDWINSNLLLERLKWTGRLVSRSVDDHDHGDHTHSVVDARAYFVDRGFTSADAIVGFLLEMTMEGDFTDLERNTALDILNEEAPFAIDAPEAEVKLRRLLGMVLSYPAYQFQ